MCVNRECSPMLTKGYHLLGSFLPQSVYDDILTLWKQTPLRSLFGLRGKNNNKTHHRFAAPGDNWCTLGTDLPLSLFIKREVYAYVFRRCEIVGPISAGHQYNNVMRTKPSACYRFFVVLSRQLPSARRRSDRQNSSGPMTTAVHGPTGTAISTRGRPDKSMLLW